VIHVPRVHEYRGVTDWVGASAGGTTGYDSYSREYAFSIEGKPVLRGSADPTFRGDARLHNPEELLLCALSACHLLSYLALCARAGIVVDGYRDEAAGSMTFADGRMRFTEVVLRPRVTLAAGDPGRATALHAKARDECFIANSVNFPVRHEPLVSLRETRR
jgi:organic hydroperoxide reductase OsmC/OhrA